MLYLDQRWGDSPPHVSGSDVLHRRCRRGTDSISFILAAARKGIGEGGSMDAGFGRGIMEGPENMRWQSSGVGRWELEEVGVMGLSTSSGTGVRLAVTLHLVDPSFASRFTRYLLDLSSADASTHNPSPITQHPSPSTEHPASPGLHFCS
jgi:hypothetical protein